MTRTRESAGRSGDLGRPGCLIDEQAHAVMISTPFNIEWVIQISDRGKFHIIRGQNDESCGTLLAHRVPLDLLKQEARIKVSG